MDTYSRFSDKAEFYVKYRWDYAPQAIEVIFELCGLSPQSRVADIGAGPGTLSRHFVERVQQVFAIEPNPEMRKIATEDLEKYSSLRIIDALSDATTLPDSCVDLIVVGRAIHWFPPESTRREFLRILKPDGWLAIFQNPWKDTKLKEELKQLETEMCGWNAALSKARLQLCPLGFYYGSEKFKEFSFPDSKQETWQEFLGRNLSFSPAPKTSDPLYSSFERLAREIFDRYSSGGKISLAMATEVCLGQMEIKREGVRSD